MENSDFLIAVVLYVAVVALAVGWFVLPRWIFGSKALKVHKARLDLRGPPLGGEGGQRDAAGLRQARLFPDSTLR